MSAFNSDPNTIPEDQLDAEIARRSLTLTPEQKRAVLEFMDGLLDAGNEKSNDSK